MCKLIKIYQQTFTYNGAGTLTTVSHHFNRVYKTKSEQYFKIKPIYVSTVEPLLMTDFNQINSVCNYEKTDGSQSIGSSNKFYLGCFTSHHSPEVIVDEIPLSNFRIVNTDGDALDDYMLVFQIELWE